MRLTGSGRGLRAPRSASASLVGSGLCFALVASFVCFAAAWPAYGKRLPSRPINLNTATLSQLEELPDVGSVMAHAILRFREYGGPFERVDDLLAIPGISHRRLDKIRPYVYVRRERKSSRSRHHGDKSSKGAARSGS